MGSWLLYVRTAGAAVVAACCAGPKGFDAISWGEQSILAASQKSKIVVKVEIFFSVRVVKYRHQNQNHLLLV